MSPMQQRMITVVAGFIGGGLIHWLGAYGLTQPAADLLGTAVASWMWGWATKHFADVKDAKPTVIVTPAVTTKQPGRTEGD